MHSNDYQRRHYIQALSQRLVFNKDKYTLTVFPEPTSFYNISLNFTNIETKQVIKLVMGFKADYACIILPRDNCNIQHIPAIFNVGDMDLNQDILTAIDRIDAKHKFVNCFLFGNQRLSIDNNYTSAHHKIHNPLDFVTFSKELKPFLPSYCLNSYFDIKVLIRNDFSGIMLDYALTCKIDGNTYAGNPDDVLKELLTDYACTRLNKRLEDLTFRDHTLLEMLKI